MAIDNYLLENGDNLLLEDGVCVLVIEGAVATADASAGGHISRKPSRKPNVVFVDQEEEEPINEAPVPERRILRMTPEVKAMLDRHKKKGPRDGLVGNGKGLIN